MEDDGEGNEGHESLERLQKSIILIVTLYIVPGPQEGLWQWGKVTGNRTQFLIYHFYA